MLRRCIASSGQFSSRKGSYVTHRRGFDCRRLHQLCGGQATGCANDRSFRTESESPRFGQLSFSRTLGAAAALTCRRSFGARPESQEPTWRRKKAFDDSHYQTWWIAAGVTSVFAGVFALVPLYKIYCQQSGEGQAVQTGHKEYQPPPPEGSEASKRLISVDFNGTVHNALPWKFTPQQRRIVVGLGETALAFYRAENTSDKPIIGTSVYHMIPAEAGLYFNKIQCFCFDEQLINPHEEVDLPVFFFIDPMWAQDSRFDHIDHITLAYLFYESDSELPEEYSQFQKAKRSEQAPVPLGAAAAPVPSAAGATS